MFAASGDEGIMRDMAVYACTKCGWVRRFEEGAPDARCEVCGANPACLTPAGGLPHRSPQLAAATAKALHARRV
jgi:rubredoxin